MRVTRGARAIVFLLVLALFAAACGDDGDSADTGGEGDGDSAETTTTLTPQDGGTITMGTYIEPSGLDPVVAQGGGTGGNHEMGAIYGTLMRYDSEAAEYVPYMAESLEGNADSTAFTLKLREGITFTDGSPYNADAVVFSMKRHTQYGSSIAGQVAIISEYTVVDPLTVEFKLKSPWPSFGYLLSNTPGMITSMQAVQTACPDPAKPARECSFSNNPVGAGPFMLERWTPKDSINLVKNPDYWAGPVHLDGLKFVTLAGAQITYESVKSGQLQVGFLREAPAIIEAEEDESVNTITNVLGMGGIALLNNGQVTCRGGRGGSVCADKPDGIVDLQKATGDVRVRQAIAAALNVDTMNQRRNEGEGLAGTAIFLEGPLAGDETAEYNADEAKKLLDEYKAETGWNGAIKVTCLDTGSGPAFVQAMEAMLNSVGFQVTGAIVPATEYISQVQINRDYDVACWGFNVPPEAPEAGLARHVLSIAGGNSGGNAMNLNNPEIDAIIGDVRSAESEADKKAALDELTTVWSEEMPSVIFENTRETIASSTEVHGIKLNVATSVMFDEAWLSS
jgi:peptide/nickel transport system substrate-binding protein